MSLAAWITAIASGVLAAGLIWRALGRTSGRHTDAPAPDNEWLETLRRGNSRATRRLTRATTERGWMLSNLPYQRRKRRIRPY